MTERTHILFDSRACAGQGTDDASVMEVSGSAKEARKVARRNLYGAVACYSFQRDGQNLSDTKWEWDWFPKTGFSDGGK